MSLPRVSNELGQVDDRLVREYGGFGLGLPMCKRLADLIDATLTVQSVVERGSTFTRRLPVRSRPDGAA